MSQTTAARHEETSASAENGDKLNPTSGIDGFTVSWEAFNRLAFYPSSAHIPPACQTHNHRSAANVKIFRFTFLRLAEIIDKFRKRWDFSADVVS